MPCTGCHTLLTRRRACLVSAVRTCPERGLAVRRTLQRRTAKLPRPELEEIGAPFGGARSAHGGG